jgi:hypothetical protein
MRVALSSDSAVIGRTLTDLLAALRCEITAPESGVPTVRYQNRRLELIAPNGDVQALGPAIGLRTLASELQRLQRSAKGAPLALSTGWRLEPLARMLHHEEGQHVPLTEKETLLLAALHAAHPAAASREQLLRDVWAYAGDSETHTLETHIYRLRSKLAELTPPAADIATLDGTYRLVISL